MWPLSSCELDFMMIFNMIKYYISVAYFIYHSCFSRKYSKVWLARNYFTFCIELQLHCRNTVSVKAQWEPAVTVTLQHFLHKLCETDLLLLVIPLLIIIRVSWQKSLKIPQYVFMRQIYNIHPETSAAVYCYNNDFSNKYCSINLSFKVIQK